MSEPHPEDPFGPMWPTTNGHKQLEKTRKKQSLVVSFPCVDDVFQCPPAPGRLPPSKASAALSNPKCSSGPAKRCKGHIFFFQSCKFENMVAHHICYIFFLSPNSKLEFLYDSNVSLIQINDDYIGSYWVAIQTLPVDSRSPFFQPSPPSRFGSTCELPDKVIKQVTFGAEPGWLMLGYFWVKKSDVFPDLLGWLPMSNASNGGCKEPNSINY